MFYPHSNLMAHRAIALSLCLALTATSAQLVGDVIAPVFVGMTHAAGNDVGCCLQLRVHVGATILPLA
jgi:hypothetical protein